MPFLEITAALDRTAKQRVLRKMLVTAASPDGPLQFVVPVDTPGITIQRKRSLDLTRDFADVTFTGTLDLRAQKEFAVGGYRLAIVVDAYNLTNLAEEVEERVVSGPAFRTPAAIQPPRTVRVGARLTF